MARSLPFDPIDEAGRQWDRNWGGQATPAMHAVTSVMRAQQILLARLNERLKPFELTFPRYEALMLLYLSRAGSLPLGKMGVRLQVHRTSVASLVEGLERSGFVRRVAHEQDGRMTLIEITEAGRATGLAATEILNAERFETAPLARNELETLSRALGTIRADAGDFPAA